MLDNDCKDGALDGCSVPRVQDGFLVARCVCGATRTVPTTTVTNSPPCNCGATTGDGLMQGPDRAAIVALMSRPSASDQDNVVYFARVAGLVKIGTTNNVWRRHAQLGHPELLGVIPGGYAAEREHHRMFADEHVHGEVFRASPRLLAYVEEHGTQPEPPEPRPAGDPDWQPPGWMRD